MSILEKAKKILEKGPGIYNSRGVRITRATNYKHVYYIVRHGNVFRSDPKIQKTVKIL